MSAPVRTGAAIVAAVLSATTLAAPAHAAVSYRAVELAGLPNATSSAAYDINDKGEIVGASTVGSATHAVLWRNGVPTDLGTLGSNYSWAASVNNSGDVVGTSLTADSQYHAFVWRDGTMTDLGGGLPGSEFSRAHAINDRGEIVGVSENGLGNRLIHAVMCRDGKIRDLSTLDNQMSYAQDVNNSGIAVGGATIDGLNVVPVRWTPAGIRTISTDVGDATAINNRGWVVGQAGEDVLLWRRGQAVRIGPALGDHGLDPADINNLGTVAGISYPGSFVWRNGVTTLLPQPPIPNHLYSRAEAINDDGQVVGSTATGTPENPLGHHAIVWVPVS